MQIIVICTHTFGMPTINSLAQAKFLKGIITTDRKTNVQDKIAAVGQQYQIPILKVSKNNFAKKMVIFIKQHKADVVFVFAFGQLIPEKLLKLPKWGFVNFHPGILPQFRGPDPVFWQLKQQLSAGGLTVHRMDAKFDTGPVVTILPIPIQPEMTYSHFLSEAGFAATNVLNMLIQTLHQMGQLPVKAQDQSKGKYQNRPTAKDFRIHWAKDEVSTIQALVNACNPRYGGAHTLLRNHPLQILAVTPMQQTTTAAIGEIIEIEEEEGLLVACKGGSVLRIDIVSSAEGIMTANRFARMAGVKIGELFT